MVTKCRQDCEFYCLYTGTCDYTLLMYETKGCPTDACTKYKPGTGRRRVWSFARRASSEIINCGEDKELHEPEQRTEPREKRCIIPGCGHEVYEGESAFEWEDGRLLCPECIESKFNEMSTEDKAALLGCERVAIASTEI